ncbi:hypothetical protein ACFLTP_09030 [Chloroflexota bacterium]
MIFGYKIPWLRRKSQRRRRAATKLERLTNATLLNAALKDPEVLAQLINKYGQIKVCHEDEMEATL